MGKTTAQLTNTSVVENNYSTCLWILGGAGYVRHLYSCCNRWSTKPLHTQNYGKLSPYMCKYRIGNNTKQTLSQALSQHNEKYTLIYLRTTPLTTHSLVHTNCWSTTIACEYAILEVARETPIFVNWTDQNSFNFYS